MFHFELGANKKQTVMDSSASGGTLFGTQEGRNASLGVTTGTNNVKSGGLGIADFTGCEIGVAPVPGYTATPITLGRVSVFEPRVGVIFLHPLEKAKGTTVSTFTLAAPKDARKSHEKGVKELTKRNADLGKAKTHLQKAVQAYPEFSEAWTLLGEILLAQDEVPNARDAFVRAMEADPNYLAPYLALSRLEMMQTHWLEAAQFSYQAIALNPFIPQAHYLHAVSSFQLGHYEMAEESIQAIKKSRGPKRFPLLHYLNGAIHSHKGDYSAAAAELSRFLEEPMPVVANALIADVRTRLAEWERQGLIPAARRNTTMRVERP